MSRTVFVTYYTEGPPHDAGIDLSRPANALLAAARESCDEVRGYTPREIASWGPRGQAAVADYSAWIADHPLRHQLRVRHEVWERTGFFMWKPFLLLRILESAELEPDDVVIYHDANVEKFPQYLAGASSWSSLAREVLAQVGTDFFMPFGVMMRFDVKAHLIRRYLDDRASFQRGLWAGLAILRKSEGSLSFVRAWSDLSSDLENISPLPNSNPYPEAAWHSTDQSVGGVLVEQWRRRGLLPRGWPFITFEDRSFTRQALRLVPGRRRFPRMTLLAFRALQTTGLLPLVHRLRSLRQPRPKE